jgi:hypothetical protein
MSHPVNSSLTLPVLLGVLAVLWPARADAYIDPGTTGAISQFLFPLIAALVAMLGLAWRRLFTSLSRVWRTRSEHSVEAPPRPS